MKIVNVFNTLTLIQISWKTKTFFKKNWSTVFYLKPLRLKTLFSFKTALSEANVKTKRIATKKWTYHTEWDFASNYLFFWKIFFQF